MLFITILLITFYVSKGLFKISTQSTDANTELLSSITEFESLVELLLADLKGNQAAIAETFSGIKHILASSDVPEELSTVLKNILIKIENAKVLKLAGARRKRQIDFNALINQIKNLFGTAPVPANKQYTTVDVNKSKVKAQNIKNQTSKIINQVNRLVEKIKSSLRSVNAE